MTDKMRFSFAPVGPTVVIEFPPETGLGGPCEVFPKDSFTLVIGETPKGMMALQHLRGLVDDGKLRPIPPVPPAGETHRAWVAAGAKRVDGTPSDHDVRTCKTCGGSNAQR